MNHKIPFHLFQIHEMLTSNSFLVKLTDVEPNDIGFTNILSCAELYFSNIDSDVNISKDCFGFTVKDYYITIF